MFEINSFKMTLQKCDFSKSHHLLFGEVIPWENEPFLWKDIHSFGAFTTRNIFEIQRSINTQEKTDTDCKLYYPLALD